ncbi:hypothetical protein ACFP1I_27145 [Dyadobacter subterraneus]|uniref:Type II toxin-antitoxin system Phd/YefM family antitoxin n=1 Tax=Dyadobacter subterraneus TaxID=2773304 RepID=A0ABR9WMF4_9BACT|nr:type II toxin-antitoxin system Phd/YefM family antitoxin [Dyadobacter subterraneus]MBE9465546.1 type II toxin-antitoxin system Phd/YefM family antitoxin [Dyadobacter subterraneus]
MIALHPKYIVGNEGEQLVVLPLNEFDNIIEALEDQEDVRLYDEAKKENDGTRILFSDYLNNRESKNA